MYSWIIIIFFYLPFCAFAQDNSEKLKNDINTILSDELFESSQAAIDIYDLTKKKSLYDRNRTLLFHPASNMKLFTSAAGLLFLPEDFRFTTSFYYTGKIEGVTLYGDLYVVGGLDPAFSIDDLDSVVNIIKSLGIKYITENIYADLSIKDSLYWGKGWMWDDDPDPTAPYLGALNINDNSIEVFVEAGESDSIANVILIPETDYVSVENNVTAHSSLQTNLEITRDWVNRKNHIFIEGVVRKGEIIDSSDHKEKLNILEPENYFLTLLKEKLNSAGVLFSGNIAAGKLPEESKIITSIARSVDTVFINSLNTDSDNLKAEMLLLALALNDSGAPALVKNGIEAINKLIDSIGFNRDDYSFADGSGVSRYNLVSSELIIGLLKFMYVQESFKIFYNSLAVAGIDGTLEKRMIGTKAENNLHAKTGTLSGVSALSGYVKAKNGNLIAFSILIQNYVEKASVIRKIQDRICELLANYE